MEREYIFHSDPGHGWLEVSYTELHRLGITDKITSYSYRLYDFVFLEEDCDYATFAEAKKAAGEPFTVKEQVTDTDSFIRRLARYYTSWDGPTEGVIIHDRLYR